MDLKRHRMGLILIGLIWLRMRTSGGAVVNTVMNFRGFHKMLGNSSVAVQLAVSQEGLSSMELLQFS
jgi:hypothetical protein